MAKKPRVTYIAFGEEGVVNDFEQFGSRAQDGVANYTKNVALIQALPAWVDGWKNALLSGNRAPFVEDMNALCLVVGYEMGYLFQEGVPEWDANTEYHTGSIVKRAGTTELYGSRINDNVGNALPTARTSDTNWEFLGEKINGYRRPRLVWVSSSLVDVEAQTGLANTTSILFPDGTMRTVNEDVSSTDKYRRFNMAVNANWTSGTEESGLRPGLSEANNTWYAIYAVKSQIDPTKFVLVGDTTFPIQASFATLNTRYGDGAWLYLGSIRNGWNSFGFDDDVIIPFIQNGNRFRFVSNPPSSGNLNGMVCVSGNPTSIVWFPGGAASLPPQVTSVFVIAWNGGAPGSTVDMAFAANGTPKYAKMQATNTGVGQVMLGAEMSVDQAIVLNFTTSPAPSNCIIMLSAWTDPVLEGLNNAI